MNRQRGWVQFVIILIVLAAVSTAAWAAVSAYNGAIEDAQKNKALAEKVAGERDGWIDVAAQQDAAKLRAEAALLSKEQARRKLQEERDRARGELLELRKKPENVAWLDQPVPPDIVAWLRGTSGAKPPSPQGGGAGAPAVAPGVLPGAAVRGEPQRRSAPIR